MKFLAILALVVGALASDDECPTNQHYNDCGTLCPVTCDNYKNPPEACFLMCNPGCECDDGYVKDKDGSCVKPGDCPVPEEKNCVDKPDSGMCRGNFPMWYYDEDTRDCKEFTYGGCQGNGNRYGSKTECLKSCASIWESDSDRCLQPIDTGLCRGYFFRYYFDKVAGQCKKFVYGGCGGNENNFKTEEECENACGNRAGEVCGENERYNGCGTACPVTCENYDNPPKICPAMCKIGCECEKGFVRRADGKCVRPRQCPNRQALHASNACEEDKEVGPCKAAFARFYFNKKTGQCEPFIYGGCEGNSNNFLSLEDCEDVCIY